MGLSMEQSVGRDNRYDSSLQWDASLLPPSRRSRPLLCQLFAVALIVYSTSKQPNAPEGSYILGLYRQISHFSA